MTKLFKHVGKVEEGESYQAAVDEVSEGIQKQANRALERFKLLNQMQHQKSMIAEWYSKVRDQAARYVWVDYNEYSATQDWILIQTSSTKLQRKINTEDLGYKEIVM